MHWSLIVVHVVHSVLINFKVHEELIKFVLDGVALKNSVAKYKCLEIPTKFFVVFHIT